MKEKVPARVYYRVGLQLFFTLIIVWYFSFRLLQLVFQIPEYSQLLFYTSLVFSIGVCLSLTKRGIKDEMKNKDDNFSLVAKNPHIHKKTEKITKQYVINRVIASFFISLVITLPITAIATLKLLSGKSKLPDILVAFINGYWKYYVICFICVVFLSFFIKYVVDNWDWTKKQF